MDAAGKSRGTVVADLELSAGEPVENSGNQSEVESMSAITTSPARRSASEESLFELVKQVRFGRFDDALNGIRLFLSELEIDDDVDEVDILSAGGRAHLLRFEIYVKRGLGGTAEAVSDCEQSRRLLERCREAFLGSISRLERLVVLSHVIAYVLTGDAASVELAKQALDRAERAADGIAVSKKGGDSLKARARLECATLRAFIELARNNPIVAQHFIEEVLHLADDPRIDVWNRASLRIIVLFHESYLNPGRVDEVSARFGGEYECLTAEGVAFDSAFYALLWGLKQGSSKWLERALEEFDRLGSTLLADYARAALAAEGAEGGSEALARCREVAELVGDDFVVAGKEIVDAVSRVRRIVAKVPNATILFNGESGVGKGELARLAHRLSGRTGTMVEGEPTTTGEMLEKKLFGAVRGSYTGATSDSIGLCERVGDGTLFLDEIDKIPVAIADKLLRFLDKREFVRLGEEHKTRSARNALVVVAASQPVEDLVASGLMRRDFQQRISRFVVRIPPLREMQQYLAALSEHLTQRFARMHRSGPVVLQSDARIAIGSYMWPGNVRELRNVIESAVLALPQSGGAVIGRDLIEREIALRDTARSGGSRDGLLEALATRFLAVGEIIDVLSGKRAALSQRLPDLLEIVGDEILEGMEMHHGIGTSDLGRRLQITPTGVQNRRKARARRRGTEEPVDVAEEPLA